MRQLMESSACRLPLVQSFAGVGIYALHYRGRFPPYASLGEERLIYVGKAALPGKRSGRSQRGRGSNALFRRLADHTSTLEAADNLKLADFSCRWLVLDQIWIELAEQALISRYQPLWNVVVDGFGNKDPGGGRYNQKRSPWDTLHPGREWAARLRDGSKDAAQILSAIKDHLRAQRGGPESSGASSPA